MAPFAEGLIDADHCAASTRLAAQITRLEACAPRWAGEFSESYFQMTMEDRGVLEQEGFVLSGLHEGFLGIAVLNAEAPLEPPVPSLGTSCPCRPCSARERWISPFSSVVKTPGFRYSPSEVLLEAYQTWKRTFFEPVSSDATFLNNGDSRGFVVVEIHVAVTVGIEGRQLRLGIQQVGAGDRLSVILQ